ncbi:MAG TPA: thiamine phosphate synthase [Kofleriaceae bacterium]|jgi:thiamine-phosphate pyrophosphorylase
MKRQGAIRGFYAVLDRDDEVLARQLLGVARVLQVRIKPGSAEEILRVAQLARRLCDEVGALLIVNDRVDLALASGADGVHLGQTDLPIEEARRFAPELVIGVSTHDVRQVEDAVASGADYLGFGPIFATQTKENPDPVQGIAGLRAAVGAARGTPIVAIGGIAASPAVAREVYGAGAAAICAIRGVNHAGDISAAARVFAI